MAFGGAVAPPQGDRAVSPELRARQQELLDQQRARIEQILREMGSDTAAPAGMPGFGSGNR